ncbi:MAG TPA: choice-of-anchor E domain-containing protein [Chitinophagaceae bacterium]|nr:choice-of-anchor E domain-containing protein [Chitinophagaceae bacterium]
MRYVYSRFISVTILLLFLFVLNHTGYAQCSGGGPAGQTAYDTTIATPEGINSMQIKFPKFDPLTGMVTCVRLCITITGVVDSVSVENNSASPQTANVYYIRTDQITGPGLVSPLSNSVNYTYGPFSLDATDGVAGSGLDFTSISDDTVLNAVSVCRTLNDSTTLAQFYGTDSVTYNYDISAFTSITCTGGNYNSSISTSAFVNFRFEYCTCPPVVLPSLNVSLFTVTKLSGDKAELKWSGFEDENSSYHYEAQVSRDGRNFSSISSFPKNTTNNSPYRLVYRTVNGESGIFFFRIKQVYSNGYSRFSNIRQVELKNSDFPPFTLYPNPSNGIVGIKFDNITDGHFKIQIYNTQGQMMVEKEIVTGGSSYVKVATLESGVYWLRLTDVKSQSSCVNQLLIK